MSGPRLTPILPVHDLALAVDWYRRAGADVERYDDTYAWVRWDGHEVLHLNLVDGMDPASNHAEVYLHLADIDGWHTMATEAGFAPTPLRDEPWGMREFAVTDPSGNRLRAGCHVH